MEIEQARESEAEQGERLGWWHHSHPTFAGITGFFAGMLFVTALPGAFAGLPRVRQHQMVYAALKGQMGGELHALALETSAPPGEG